MDLTTEAGLSQILNNTSQDSTSAVTSDDGSTATSIKSSYSFPLNYEGNHHFRLSLIDYGERQDFAYNSGPAYVNPNDTTGAIKNTLTSIWFPMPDQIATNYGPSWDFANLETAGLAIHGAMDLYKKFGDIQFNDSLTAEDKGAKLGGLFKDAAIDQLGPAFLRAVVRKLVPQNYADGFDVARGITANPFKESIFRGVANRAFTFSWNLYPRNEQETNQLKSIINAIKYWASPSLNGDLGALMNYPSEFVPSFMNGSTLNQYLPKIGVCVCTSIDVNWTSSGQWSALPNGHPVDVALTLSFVETEIITRDKVNAGY